jgi:hypothetical protein
MMSEQGAGRWLVWGAGTPAEVQANALAGLGSALASALSNLPPVSLDEQDPDGTAADCGEGDLFDDPDEDARLIALIYEQDPDWTPPGRGHPEDPSGKISWMEVVRNATERDIQAKVAAHGTAARGFVRLT